MNQKSTIIKGIKSIVVCVDFDDFLSITLPQNKIHFDRTLVVTSSQDKKTQQVARIFDCECLITDTFYRGGADFNKGLAMEEGFDRLGRNGWITIWDADIIMPKSIVIPWADPQCLYTPIRRLLENPTRYSSNLDWSSLPSPTKPEEFDGYFQLFHASSVPETPWYTTNWIHAGGCDSDFQRRFLRRDKQRPSYEVLHLGVEGIVGTKSRVGQNWRGRTIPRLDTGEIPKQATRRKESVLRMIEDRKRWGVSKEKIQHVVPISESKIPRRMSFFWDGRMSWLRFMTLKSFCLFNPDWEVNLYQPDTPCIKKTWKSLEDHDHQYQGVDYREHLNDLPVTQKIWRMPQRLKIPPAHACDLFEWWVLSTGGFFADMDILWLQPLQSVLNTTTTADVIWCLEDGHMAIGFFGSVPDCRLFHDLYRKAISHKQPNRYQYYGTEHVYRTAVMTKNQMGHPQAGVKAIKILNRRYRFLEFATVPDYTVYPFDWREISSLFKKKNPIPKESSGLHWFGGSPEAQKWNNLITPDNYPRYETTLTCALQRILG